MICSVVAGVWDLCGVISGVWGSCGFEKTGVVKIRVDDLAPGVLRAAKYSRNYSGVEKAFGR